MVEWHKYGLDWWSFGHAGSGVGWAVIWLLWIQKPLWILFVSSLAIAVVWELLEKNVKALAALHNNETACNIAVDIVLFMVGVGVVVGIDEAV